MRYSLECLQLMYLNNNNVINNLIGLVFNFHNNNKTNVLVKTVFFLGITVSTIISQENPHKSLFSVINLDGVSIPKHKVPINTSF